MTCTRSGRGETPAAATRWQVPCDFSPEMAVLLLPQVAVEPQVAAEPQVAVPCDSSSLDQVWLRR
jgi:hypothetical protein